MIVLFVCVGNASRSVMAEAFFNALAANKARALSAGTRPAPAVGQKTVEAMAEVGIDISGHRPQAVTPELLKEADRAIGMGCGIEETCPAELGLRLDEDWGLEDTRYMGLEETRAVRDDIRRRVESLVKELGL